MARGLTCGLRISGDPATDNSNPQKPLTRRLPDREPDGPGCPILAVLLLCYRRTGLATKLVP
jgi:hypothetical protein